MKPTRTTNAVAGFPYRAATTCYIKVNADNAAVTTGTPTQADLDSCAAGDLQIFAAWPGQWRTDLFIVDDLQACALALGLVPPTQTAATPRCREHDLRWSYGPWGRSGSVTERVEVAILCGCQFPDIHTVASELRTQLGWNVRTTTGWGRGQRGKTRTLSLPVQRTSIDTPQARRLYVQNLDRIEHARTQVATGFPTAEQRRTLPRDEQDAVAQRVGAQLNTAAVMVPPEGRGEPLTDFTDDRGVRFWKTPVGGDQLEDPYQMVDGYTLWLKSYKPMWLGGPPIWSPGYRRAQGLD